MSDEFTAEEWGRFRTLVIALWVGFVFSVGALAMTPAGWGATLLIFGLVTGSFVLNLGRKVFAPLSVVIVCLTTLYLAQVWPNTDTMMRIAQLVPH